MRYRTVLLDAGETLFGPRETFGAVYARVLAHHGLDHSAEEFEEALGRSWQELNRLIPPGQDRYSFFPGGEAGYWLRFLQGILERITGKPLPEDHALKVLDSLRDAFRHPEAWEVFTDVPPTLRALRRGGVRLGVVSNWDTKLPLVLERLGLAPYLDAVAVSSIEGVEKPDPAIFHRILERLDADPETTIHVGDLPDIDLAGARAAGLRGVLVDRRGRLDSALEALPDLRPLPELVRDG